jgi:hypothetical protein
MKARLLFLILLQILTFPLYADDSIDDIAPSVKPLDFSKPLSAKELMAAGQLGGLLYPTEDIALPNSPIPAQATANLANANQSFGQAIEAWNRHQYKDAYRLFGDHIQTFPNSPPD